MNIYTYSAVIVRVHDGDTIVVDLDLGRRIWVRDAPHRLAGIAARELNMPGGVEARDYLAGLLPAGAKVTLQSLKPYKYGDSYMAKIVLPEGGDVAALLIAQGWALPWDGKGAQPVPVWPRRTDEGQP
jgi:endonuclease YncB( thermonuclease family)